MDDRNEEGLRGLGWILSLTRGRAPGAEAWKCPQGPRRKPPASHPTHAPVTTWSWVLEKEQLCSGGHKQWALEGGDAGGGSKVGGAREGGVGDHRPRAHGGLGGARRDWAAGAALSAREHRGPEGQGSEDLDPGLELGAMSQASVETWLLD